MNASNITSQTQYLFKSYGVTERANSQQNKHIITDTKSKPETLKSKGSNREANRTVINSSNDN